MGAGVCAGSHFSIGPEPPNPNPQTPDASPAAGYVAPMKPNPTPVLLLGGALFLLGAVLLLLWMEGRSGLFLGFGLGAVCISALTLALAGGWMWKGGDPLHARREQRLWRSGPLGRWWLGRRKKRP